MVAWLDEARADITLERDIRAAARSWDTQGRSDDDVLRGGRLELAADWAARRGDIPLLVGELIEASRDRAERDDRALRAQLAREQRSKRRLRGVLVAAVLLLVIALAAGALFLVQRNDAQEAARLTKGARAGGRVDACAHHRSRTEHPARARSRQALPPGRRCRADRGDRGPARGGPGLPIELRRPIDDSNWHLVASDSGGLLAMANPFATEATVWDAGRGEVLRPLTGTGTAFGGLPLLRIRVSWH